MPAATSPKKKASKRAAPTHAPFKDLIAESLIALKERNGSSRQAICKFIAEHHGLTGEANIAHVKQALKRGVITGDLIQVKGTGASGSFKLSAAAKKSKAAPRKRAPAASTKAVASSPKKTSRPKSSKPKASKLQSSAKPKSSKPTAKSSKAKPKSSPVKKTAAKKSTKKASPKKALKSKSAGKKKS